MIQFCVTESWKPYFIDLKLMLDTSSSESVCVYIYCLPTLLDALWIMLT